MAASAGSVFNRAGCEHVTCLLLLDRTEAARCTHSGDGGMRIHAELDQQTRGDRAGTAEAGTTVEDDEAAGA